MNFEEYLSDLIIYWRKDDDNIYSLYIPTYLYDLTDIVSQIQNNFPNSKIIRGDEPHHMQNQTKYPSTFTCGEIFVLFPKGTN